MSNKGKAFFRIALGVIMLLIGLLFVDLSSQASGTFNVLVHSLGLSFIVTGSVTVFQEAGLSWFQPTDEVREGFNRIFNLFQEPSIHMLATQRRGHSRYHRWLLETDSQEIFFAGHSVLHRIQADFDAKGLPSVERALKQKISEGSKIRILLLDPTWDFINQIARDQGQDSTNLRTDLATSLGICRRLLDTLENERLAGEISIHTCREFQQYAIHHVNCVAKNERDLLVGFYFARRVGMKSPLFVVENEQVRDYFIEHFNTVFDRAKSLLTYSHDGTRFDFAYYDECKTSLAQYLNPQVLASRCP